jgi:branched-chain amino acid transport system ATP-binding protein
MNTTIDNTITTILEVDDLLLRFGGISALDRVSLKVKRGSILAIIGPNGAGKTSLINCITRFYRQQEGKIFFEGSSIDKLGSHAIARLGIARTYQNIELFAGLTTLDNLIAARHIFFKHNFMESILPFGRSHSEEIKHRGAVEEIIDFLEMNHIRKRVVATLPYGLRKRVEFGRALALEPKLLLLDEPVSGMNVEEKEDMARFILDVQEQKGITIVLVEHDMGVVMDISDTVVALDFGRKIAEGSPDEVKCNKAVIKAYLGEE